MPKVWTLLQRGISSPSPARSPRSSASPRSREKAVEATGTCRPASSTRGRRRKRSAGRGPFTSLRSPRAGAAPLVVSRANPRSGNYESGSDYVLEYGELRFSFNEQDFAQRVEQAAVKLDFVDHGLSSEELVDLLELAVNGEIREPTSELGEHINEHWTELVGPANRSLVHWIRRLVFRGAWLDQRVKEGELDVVFDPDTQTFGYVQPERDSEPIELSREPSWARLAYRR
jgi:hypothetical protein